MDRPQDAGDSDYDDYYEGEIDLAFQLLARELSEEGHPAFAYPASGNPGDRDHDVEDEDEDEEEDEEEEEEEETQNHLAFHHLARGLVAERGHPPLVFYDEDYDDDEFVDEETERDLATIAGLIQERSAYHSDSDATSDHDPLDSDFDSESPESPRSPSTAGSRSPSESSTASEDLLFVRQQEDEGDEEDLDAYPDIFAANPYEFPYDFGPARLAERSNSLQRIAVLEGIRRHRLENGIQGSVDRLIDDQIHSLREEQAASVHLDLEDELFEMEFGGVPPVRVPGEVIDLTNEPDSPEENARLRNHGRVRHRATNPRRQQSLGRTPSLSRSDGSILGGGRPGGDRNPGGGRNFGAAPVIDLTMEDDAPYPAPAVAARNPATFLPPPAQLLLERGRGHYHSPIEVIEVADDDNRADNANRGFMEMMDRFRRDPLNQLQLHLPGAFGALFRVESLNAPAVPNPLGDNMPNFNYGNNGYNNQGQEKPPFIPPPPARPGFGRDTAENLAFVCPSCEEELKYDPDAGQDKTRPTKKVHTRKDREEHHFWAVKECGHVYCKKCYEDRRPLRKTSTPKTKFRSLQPRSLLCAIEDCTSEVGPKSNWVGIFI